MRADPCAALPSSPRDFRSLVGVCAGREPWYADWKIHTQVANESNLSVLFVWPMEAGKVLLHRARTIAQTRCAIDDRIIFEKSVPLGPCALASLKRTVLGAPSLAANGGGAAACVDDAPPPSRLHAFVVRSATPARMDACEAALRAEACPSSGRGRDACSVHGTRGHTQAVLASQLLLHEASLSMLRVGADEAACTALAANLTHDLSIGRATLHGSRAVEAPSSPPPLLPAGLGIDSGPALELLGLRANDASPLHVSLVYDERNAPASQLLRACAYRHAGSSSRYLAPGSICRMPYISHNNQINLRFHAVPRMGELVHDPRAHAFCRGVQLLAPHALLAYRMRRFARFGWARDGADVERLKNWSDAEARACVAAGGVVERNRSSWDAPRCL